MIVKLGSKKYKNSDQLAFAQISKDFNNIHVNSQASRKLIYGNQLVHGVNILISSLIFLSKKKIKLKNISCTFYRPVFLGQKIDFFLEKKYGENYSLFIKTKKILNCVILININLIKDEIINKRSFKANKIEKTSQKKINNFKGKINSRNRFYKINISNFSLPNHFSKLKLLLSKDQIREILSISYFAGMICPGEFSLLSKIQITVNKNILYRNKYIKFFIQKFDKRINRYEIKFLNNISGKIYAFQYILTEPEKIKNLKKINKKKFLKNKYSMIIGGSRGLGEVTSKLLAIAGSNVIISYNQGKKESELIRSEILKNLKSNCKLIKINILKDDIKQKLKEVIKCDYFFYFATPKIEKTNQNKFDKSLYKKYLEFYDTKFRKLCITLNRLSKKKVKVFYPSTVFISLNNNNFKEYVAAKKVAEKNIKTLNKSLNKVKIFSYRLPIMKTNQNINIISKVKNKNAQILLPIIKNLSK